jgi:hypothetical protein
MKNLLILITFLLLSSPVNSQSSKYESVSQCVIQTMKENKLTGNKMFEMVKEECERSLGNANKSETESILYLSDMDSGKRANCLHVTKLLPANDRLNYLKICGVILQNKKGGNSKEPDNIWVDPDTGYELNLSKVGGRAVCMLVVKILPANDRIKLLRGCGLVD